jgi:3-methyladenine DNA glycosylase/8-oxoguanine DNA glycosylase
MSDEEIIAQLVGVKGIGVWTAHMFLIFALNRPDVLPVGDYGVRKAFLLAYRLDACPEPKPWKTSPPLAAVALRRQLVSVAQPRKEINHNIDPL